MKAARRRPPLAGKWDAVVIGSGIGGLLTAAHLAKEGRRVAVVEKLGFVGGRFTSVPYKGFQIPTGALHMLPYGSGGPLATMLRNLGINCGIRDAEVFASVHLDGTHLTARTVFGVWCFFSPLERIHFGRLLLKAKRTRSLDHSITFLDWLRMNGAPAKIVDLYEAFANFALAVSLDDISYVEMRRILKNLLKYCKTGFAGVPVGGCARIVDALVSLIQEHGGVVRARTQGLEILTREDRVVGVAALDGATGAAKTVESEMVVSNCGPRNTADLLRGHVDPRFRDKLSTTRVAQGLRMHFACDESMVPHGGIMLCLSEDRALGVVQPTNSDPGLAPPGKHLLIAFRILGTGREVAQAKRAVVDRLGKVYGERFVRKCQILPVSVFREAWPVNWRRQGDDLGHRTPIKGLYMVGDACKAPGYPMVEGVAKGVEALLRTLKERDTSRLW